MNSSLALLALVPPALFAAVALLAPRRNAHLAHPVTRLGTLAGFAGVAVGVALLAVPAWNGTTTSPTLGAAGLGISVRLDALSVAMLAMIAVLAAVIVGYSRTYLDGDDRRAVFLGRLAATIAAVEVMVVAGNLALLLAGWVATSLCLHRLLVFHGDRPRAAAAAHKKFVVARVGDVFLLGAAVALYRTTGTGDLGAIFEAAARAPMTWALGGFGVAATCLAIAAALKSAQFPTHGWLIEVMETPTPVSALLHAGILNAGPFLAIRMAFVLETSRTASTALIVLGALTAAFASVALLTQPSVKVALAYSSAAHMGFMLMVCGMGLYPAALLHLVAHSFYKAHAFLSSGSVVDERRAAGVAMPERLGRPTRIAASAALAVALYLPLALVFGVDLRGEPMLVAVGSFLLLGTTQLLAPAIDSAGSPGGVVRASGLALAVTTSFFTLEAGAHHLLGSTVPDLAGRDAVQTTLVALVFVGFASIVLLQILEPTRAASARRRALAVHLRNGLYANAWFDRLIGSLRTASAPAPIAPAPIAPARIATPAETHHLAETLEPTWH